MTEIKVYCDRCGKELDTIYTDREIKICRKTRKADLCTKCFEKSNDRIADFCKGKVIK